MNSLPLVSICIPVYNSEKYLEQCLNSILYQTYKNFECILVDDGSTDSSRNICNNFVEKDKRFKIFHQKNSGPSFSRNVCLQKISDNSTYLIFIDSDDFLVETALQKRIEAIGNSQLLISNYYVKTDNTIKSNYPYHLKKMTSEDFLNNLFAQRILTYQGYLWNKLFRTDIIKENKIFFNENIFCNEDRLFVFEYSLHIKDVNIINEYDYTYVQNISSITNKMKNKITSKNVTDLDAFIIMHSLIKDNMQSILPSLRQNFLNNFFFIMLKKNKTYKAKKSLKKIIKTASKNFITKESVNDFISKKSPGRLFKYIIYSMAEKRVFQAKLYFLLFELKLKLK